MKTDSRLNCIRAVAVVMIVFCHFFQIIGLLDVAFWLNTGVQIFFVLSAYLMSQKQFSSRGDVWQFYKKRILRIMIPMWIYTACLVLVLLVLRIHIAPIAILLYALGLAGFAPSGILGLGHFWYITVILICYLLVPLMDKLSRNRNRWLWTVLISLLGLALMTLVGKSAYGVNLALFLFTYMYFRTQSEPITGKVPALWAIPTVLFSILRLYLDGYDFANVQLCSLYDGIFVTTTKCLLGLWLFFMGMKVLKNSTNGRLTHYLSTRSYEIYLTHQFILLAVNEYLPLPQKGTAIGAVIMCLISVVLIFANTEALAWLMRLFRKTKVKTG